VIAFVFAALSLTVSPRQAFAPAEVRARVQIDAEAAARRLVIDLVGQGRSQSSEQPFTPSDRRQTVYVPAWRDVPPGDYLVVVTLIDSVNAIVARVVQSVRILGE
jgi:hypothetical protein